MKKGVSYPQIWKDPYVRFWNNLVPGPNGCWEWVAFRHPKMGYGTFGMGGTGNQIFAHRAAWILSKGSIPKGMCVLHKCDNPPCVNPDHLFLGTKGENNADCVNKGRTCRGERHPCSVLTERDVLKIRELKKIPRMGAISISRLLKLPLGAVSGVVSHGTWKHVI